jgi:hypothetical protein
MDQQPISRGRSVAAIILCTSTLGVLTLEGVKFGDVIAPSIRPARPRLRLSRTAADPKIRAGACRGWNTDDEVVL